MSRVSVGINVSQLYRETARNMERAADAARRKAIDAQALDHDRI